MIDPRTIFEIHRLAHAGFSLRTIARTLGIARRTAQQYLDEPNPRRPRRLEPFHDEIERLLQIDPTASAGVIRQRLEAQGFHGGLSRLRQHLRQVCAHKTPQPTIRFATPPGHQCQVDWGHSGALPYGNTSTVPPWRVGKTLTGKAAPHQLTCYLQDKAVATHSRCWQRKQRRDLPQHRELAHKHHRRSWHSQEGAALLSLGAVAQTSLERLARPQQPLTKSVKKLLALKDEYGAQALSEAMQRALHHQAMGVHDIANILYQDMPPQRHHPPVRLTQAHLNHIRLEEPSLADYDACVSRRKTR